MDGPFTAQQAADELGYHIKHVYRLLADGTLKGKQFNYVGMIDPAEVERIKALQGPGSRLPRSLPEKAKD